MPWLFVGCASEPARPLEPMDFASARDEPSSEPATASGDGRPSRDPQAADPAPRPRPPSNETPIAGPGATDERVVDDIGIATTQPAQLAPAQDATTIVPGIPRPPVVGLRPVGDPTLIDGKVGSVNGRSVLASAFFDDFQLAGRMRQLAIESLESQPSTAVARRAWRARARSDIETALKQFIEDEVVYRERISQAPEDGQGIRQVLNNIRNIIRRQSYGSEELARIWVRSQGSGETVDDFVEQINRRQTIAFELDESVNNRIGVSWREVQNYYERNIETYAPPPAVDVRLIRASVSTGDADAVRERLDGGESFADVAASDLNTYRRSDAGLFNGGRVAFDPPLARASVFGPESLNELLRPLSPGEWAGPVVQGDTANFVMLEAIHDDARTLYEVQLEIENQIRSLKTERETNRYVGTLLDGSSFTRREVMTERLLTFAEQTYFDPLAGDG